MKENLNIGNQKSIHHQLLILLESTAYQQEFYFTSELFFFLIQYSFLFSHNDTDTKTCNLKTTHFLIPQENGENGARYLDPKYSRWLSTDPALSSYVERNYNGPSGDIYNSVNLNLYHYAGNNPVKYVDPDGRETKNSETQEFVNNLGNNPKSLISEELPIVTNLKEAGWTFIGNDEEEVFEVTKEIKYLAEDSGTMVNSFTKQKEIKSMVQEEKNIKELFSNAMEIYKSRSVGARPSVVTERNSESISEKKEIYNMQIYTVSGIDLTTGKIGGIYRSFIDINNDGNIDCTMWGYNEKYDE